MFARTAIFLLSTTTVRVDVLILLLKTSVHTHSFALFYSNRSQLLDAGATVITTHASLILSPSKTVA